MKLPVSQEFLGICQQIADTAWTNAEWAEHEADDWFQTDHFDGGYDATERAFCFSCVRPDLSEYRFQLTLVQIDEVLAGRLEELNLMPAG